MGVRFEICEAAGADRPRLRCMFNGETLLVEGCGPDGVRVRAAPMGEPIDPAWSVLEPRPTTAGITLGERPRLINGRITVELRVQHRYGADVPREVVLRFLRTETGEELLAETRPHYAGPGPRSFRPLASASFRLEACFRAYEGERLYGLGQPHHGTLDLKGTTTTLLQQNTHVVVPFVVSSRGYGFLWHNPAVGRVDFARNLTRWSAEATRQLDYWVCAGGDARDIVRQYVDLTGRPPEAPDWITGFWQSKLRYRTQAELLDVAREHRRRGHPLACIVIDFFHWTKHGEWRFDPEDWPDPEAMVQELEGMGVETIVSIWPTVSPNAETWQEMRERNLLVRAESGAPVVTPFPDKDPKGVHHLAYYDPTSAAARAFLFERVRANYLAHGIANFWLDSCEPEMRPSHPEHVRLALGNGAEVLNLYPLYHQQGFRDGLRDAGRPQGVLLCRSAWAGSQKHGVVLWSGDLWSTWEDYRADVRAGLSAGLSGLAWWSSDIGGFFDGIGKDPGFRELLVRWFQFAVFSPICRLHGVRVPDELPLPADGVPTYGRPAYEIFTDTGGANEIWTYGEDLYRIFAALLAQREALRPYLRDCFAANTRTGDPIMRPLFYDFPHDAEAAAIDDAYMLGPDLLVAPILEPGASSRRVYLPGGPLWHRLGGSGPIAGGMWLEVEVTLEEVPVFARDPALAAALSNARR